LAEFKGKNEPNRFFFYGARESGIKVRLAHEYSAKPFAATSLNRHKDKPCRPCGKLKIPIKK
jgi:hypothetical protein